MPTDAKIIKRQWRVIAELESALSEERARLDWLIDYCNHCDGEENVLEDLWDRLPGDSDDQMAEMRAAIDSARAEEKSNAN